MWSPRSFSWYDNEADMPHSIHQGSSMSGLPPVRERSSSDRSSNSGSNGVQSYHSLKEEKEKEEKDNGTNGRFDSTNEYGYSRHDPLLDAEVLVYGMGSDLFEHT
eukprot:4694755-Ditylum_brightwellii.AAC.1